MNHGDKNSRLEKEVEELRSRRRALKDADARVKEAELALVASEKFSRSILDSLDVNVAVIDSDGTIVCVNDSWIRFALDNGISSLDKVNVGANYFDVCREAHGLHSAEAPAALEGLESLLSGRRSRFELEYPCDSPEVRRWFIMKARMVDVDGHRDIVVSHVDITERKLAEEAVQRSNLALEEEVRARTCELEQAKTEAELYLDVMSHDLLNINQALLGYLEIALYRIGHEGESNELIKRPLELVQKSTDLIARVKKIRSSRRFAENLSLKDLGRTISDVAEKFRPFPGRQVEISYLPRKCCFVMANDLLSEIFVNLIGNAIKHSDPRKALEINIRIDDDLAGGNQQHVVAIEDNGPGIPDDAKATLFVPCREDRQKYPGRGIGLILVKNLVEMYGGSIRVRDRIPGDYSKGTCFVVTLPAVQPQSC